VESAVTQTATGSFVETLGVASPDHERLGGKGAALTRMVAQGLAVPPGFVITADAFLATIRALGLTHALDRINDALSRGEPPDGGEVAGGLLAGRVPDDLRASIATAMSRLGLDAETLIIRSSATVEDGGDYSFAGIFESLRPDPAEGVEPTIRRVWASGFSARALAYLAESGISRVPSIAAVVQRFLEADRSGVMFTSFPAPDGEHRILVEHVEGGCEKLVKGEVTPDRIWMSRSDDLLSDPAPLDQGHATDLRRVAERLEEEFGSPQDIEWVVYDGEVYVVQSRPITAVSAAPATAQRPDGLAPILIGTATSGGVAAGPVHLVFNIEHAEAIAAGDVLVTPMTNPDMVVAMRRSAAIVTDVGGIICHAAIVSRELGLPCVVGSERATEVLQAGQTVTVDGSAGAVYDGRLELGNPAASQLVDWSGVWQQRQSQEPVAVPCLAALRSAGLRETVALVPDVDLRAGNAGLWNDLEALSPETRNAVFRAYVADVLAAADEASVRSVILTPLDDRLTAELSAATAQNSPRIECQPDVPFTPLMGAAGPSTLAGPESFVEGAVDSLRFFGHQPGVRVGAMPEPASRRGWWELLPEYGRFHATFTTERESGSYEWLEVRPELVISALLKSLVQPGFEMVPRVLGFHDLPPMHVKWIRCRYHFRADVFARVWEAIVRATWDREWLANLMRRVRRSYEHLEEVLCLFPSSADEARRIRNDTAVAVITAWWPRWTEFFALCWFIQAQGDDILYPFIAETVADNLTRAGSPPAGLRWPGVEELIAPTTPVLSSSYMTALSGLGEAARAAGHSDAAAAHAAIAAGEAPDLARVLDEHLAAWHWMRDRDLLFEPWDSAAVVLTKALASAPPNPPDYEENRRRNLFAVAFHTDLARASGRADAFATAARFLHDLNVERENHHVLWLRFSYPLRLLIVELGRRLTRVSPLDPEDVFFFQAPELLASARALPEPPTDALVRRIKNRRAGYRYEARLRGGIAPAEDEDDYY
jgi:phosphohistidine swiveling domain-containing protein